jgi:molecular chaperone GrpE
MLLMPISLKGNPMSQAEQNTVESASTERAEVERLQDELSREHNLYQRALADFENYRRRVERERENTAKRDKRELLLVLLDLADNFERALAHINDSPEAVVTGLHTIQRRLASVLTAQGVTPFESVGQSFDPGVHEAVATVQSEEQAAGTVLDELSRGYHWGDEVLRPARVRVVQ